MLSPLEGVIRRPSHLGSPPCTSVGSIFSLGVCAVGQELSLIVRGCLDGALGSGLGELFIGAGAIIDVGYDGGAFRPSAML